MQQESVWMLVNLCINELLINIFFPCARNCKIFVTIKVWSCFLIKISSKTHFLSELVDVSMQGLNVMHKIKLLMLHHVLLL